MLEYELKYKRHLSVATSSLVCNEDVE